MKKEERSRVFISYLRQYCRTLLLFLAFTGIFALVFFLYDLEIEAVLYAAGLCILLALLVLGGRFASYYRGHERRRRILQNIRIIADEMPSPQTLAEADYQEMIGELKRILDENMTSFQNERRESLDYYTTWVHQIKTPIAVMRMILQAEDTPEHRELEAELFRIEQYVEMVLGYMRLGDGASDFVFREYDLDAIIKQAIHKYAPQFVRKRISLRYKSVSVKVLTDEKWLLFMIEQVLSNAVKYTEKGTVSITVTEDKILKIADTGIGIASEDISRIFEKGFTGYNGRADKKSTGLGLYLCYRTAQMLSHEIRVESRPGMGTTVSIDLREEKLGAE